MNGPSREPVIAPLRRERISRKPQEVSAAAVHPLGPADEGLTLDQLAARYPAPQIES
ncbi:hypothetical protein RHODGE_RHODGE_01616 [Rhodoplanes serenus]|uniref:Uncharacterized protein n=1 Tax=Rhodoplanes serenus TaxID=200615 RepID=A0A3S4BF76_9BRAD|nr:hypothetical protein RHODGE_RHODGE_01616 [Rhodoplanes serenus]